MCGFCFAQNGHQLAQNSTTTVLPARSFAFSTLPSTSWMSLQRTTSGAGAAATMSGMSGISATSQANSDLCRAESRIWAKKRRPSPAALSSSITC